MLSRSHYGICATTVVLALQACSKPEPSCCALNSHAASSTIPLQHCLSRVQVGLSAHTVWRCLVHRRAWSRADCLVSTDARARLAYICCRPSVSATRLWALRASCAGGSSVPLQAEGSTIAVLWYVSPGQVSSFCSAADCPRLCPPLGATVVLNVGGSSALMDCNTPHADSSAPAVHPQQHQV